MGGRIPFKQKYHAHCIFKFALIERLDLTDSVHYYNATSESVSEISIYHAFERKVDLYIAERAGVDLSGAKDR